MADKVLPPNRLLGGYFPGDPVARPPKGSYKPPQIPKFDDFATFLDEQFKYINEVGDIPIEIKKQLQDDFENAFTVKVSPSSASSLDIPDEFAEDIGEAPGVSKISFDINPIKWAQDPKKEALGFVRNIVKSTIGYDPKKPFLEGWDFGDLETRIEQERVWSPLISTQYDENGNEVSRSRIGKPSDKINIFRGLAQSRMTPSYTDLSLDAVTIPGTPDERYIDPLDTKKVLKLGQGFVDEPKDVFTEAKTPWIQSMMNSKSMSDRNKSHASMQLAFMQAASVEATQDRSIGWSLNTNILNDLHKKYVSSQTNAPVSLADELENLKNAAASGNMRDVTKYVNSIARGNNCLLSQLEDTINTQNAGILSNPTHPLTTFIASLDNALATPNITASNLTNLATTLNTAGSTLAKGSLDLRRLTGLDREAALLDLQSRFMKSFDAYGKLFNDDSSAISLLSKARLKRMDITGNAGIQEAFDALKSKAQATKSELALLQDLLGGEKEVRKLFGVDLNSFASKVEETASNWNGKPVSTLITGLSALRNEYSGNTYNGGLKERAFNKISNKVFYSDSDTTKYLNTLEGGKRLNWLYVLENNRNRRFAAADLSKIIDEGPKGLINVKVWPKIRTQIKHVPVLGAVLFPGDFIKENVLKPVHWFGLVYEKDYKANYDAFKTNHKFIHGILKVARLDLPEHTFNVSFLVGGVKKGVKVTGGDHFKAAISLFDLLGSDSTGRLKMTNAQLWAILTANPKDIDAFINNPLLAGLKLGIKDDEALGKFLKDTRGFWKWIVKNKGSMGLDFSTPQARDASLNMLREFMLGLKMREAIPGLINATQAYAGRLQQLAEKLSIIQNWFFGTVVGKFIRPLIYLKDALAEGATQFLINLAAGATGGLGKLLHFLEPLIRFFMYKLLTWGELFIKGALKFDFSELNKEVQKTATGIVQYALVFLVVPILLILMIFDSFGTYVSAYSPVDNSRTDGEVTDESAEGLWAEILKRASEAGDCGICGPKGSIDFGPYPNGDPYPAMKPVLAAAGKDLDIPAALLAGVLYAEGQSEKYTEPWTTENVKAWSVPRGDVMPSINQSSSGGLGVYQWLEGYFKSYKDAVDLIDPGRGDEASRLNFLDTSYAAAKLFKEPFNFISPACGSGWDKEVTDPYTGQKLPLAKFRLLHYACGTASNLCTQGNFVEYANKAYQVFNAYKCW